MGSYKRLADIMKALAHPVRLEIMEALREEEACVCHLEALLGQRQAYISQQLARLRDAGLVVDRREGLNVFYRLADESLAGLLDVARDTTTRLASAEGQKLAFRLAARKATSECPCPRCMAKKDVISATEARPVT